MRTIFLLAGIVFGIFVLDRALYLGLSVIESNVVSGQSVGKVNRLLATGNKLDLVVVGNSRANHHVINSMFSQESYNVGIDGTGPKTAAILVQALGNREQLILFHIDYFELFSDRYTGKDALRLINKVNVIENLGSELFELDPSRVYLSRVLKLSVYQGKVLGILYRGFFESKKDELLGFEPLDSSTRTNRGKGTGREELEVGQQESHELNALTNKALEGVIRFARDNNKALMFFTSPSKSVLTDNQRNQIEQYFVGIGAPYRDFSGSMSDSAPDHWKDGSHLARKGAQRFTILLKRWICGSAHTLSERLKTQVCES